MERVFTYPEHTASTVQVRVYFQNFFQETFSFRDSVIQIEVKSKEYKIPECVKNL